MYVQCGGDVESLPMRCWCRCRMYYEIIVMALLSDAFPLSSTISTTLDSRWCREHQPKKKSMEIHLKLSHTKRKTKKNLEETKTSTFDYMVDSMEWELSTIKIIKWFVLFWWLVQQPAAAGSNLTELKLNVFRCFEVNDEQQQLKQQREKKLT